MIMADETINDFIIYPIDVKLTRKYHVPKNLIRESMAKHFLSKERIKRQIDIPENHPSYTQKYKELKQEEKEYVLQCGDAELGAWLVNNMNFEDFPDDVKKPVSVKEDPNYF